MSASVPKFDFELHSGPAEKFGPRLGNITITRPITDNGIKVNIPTPNIICTTTRGVVTHLSNDNVRRTTAIKWIHVPFESFLQIDPPAPTSQKGLYPLHTFLGFPSSSHVLSMSLRDPASGREMPANGNFFVTAETSRGARKVTAQDYKSYVSAVLPDIIFPLSDIPFTPPPYSQKRLTKSIERSGRYLLDLLKSVEAGTAAPRMNVFLPMVGGINEAARSAFAALLLEPLDTKDKEQILLDNLDAGVTGYSLDLLPLRQSLCADLSNPACTSIYRPIFTSSLSPLLRASLRNLTPNKPRLVNTTLSPHEILILIRDVGVELFDSLWAQKAADWGVALDFKFPAPMSSVSTRQVGHNLYDAKFANDFSRLSDLFLDGLEFSKQQSAGSAWKLTNVCLCPACTPTWTNRPLQHCLAEAPQTEAGSEIAPPYTRAYIHHLLHTHEMSAHTLLTMHNITILDSFLRDVREFLTNESDPAAFDEAVSLFEKAYDSELEILDIAKASWTTVDLARGKGRLARERAETANTQMVDTKESS